MPPVPEVFFRYIRCVVDKDEIDLLKVSFYVKEKEDFFFGY